MSAWTKPELENMLEDVVNELGLSDTMIEDHGPRGTAPSELVRLVLERKDSEIRMLKQGFKAIEAASPDTEEQQGAVSPEAAFALWARKKGITTHTQGFKLIQEAWHKTSPPIPDSKVTKELERILGIVGTQDNYYSNEIFAAISALVQHQTEGEG